MVINVTEASPFGPKCGRISADVVQVTYLLSVISTQNVLCTLEIAS